MKYYRNTRNRRLPFYSIRRECSAGKVIKFTDEEMKDEGLKHDLTCFLKVGSIEEVDETAEDIIFSSSVPPVVSVVLPKDVTIPKSAPVVLPKDVSQDNDAGHVVSKGKLPGQGIIESVGQFMDKQIKKASEMLQDAAEPVEKNTVKKEEKTLPADLVEWFKLRHAQKKLQILKMTDIKKLQYIADFDDKSRKIIAQRLKELNVKE